VIKAFVNSVAEVCMFGNSRSLLRPLLRWLQTADCSLQLTYLFSKVGGERLFIVKGLHKRGTNSMCTSHKKLCDVDCVSCMGQRHGSVLQISASAKLHKHLLMHRNKVETTW